MTHEKTIATLKTIPEQLGAAVGQLGEEQRTQARDGWTPMEILGHLKDAAVIYDQRVTRLAGEDDPRLPAYDQDAKVRAGNFNSADPGPLLAEIAEARRHTIDVLEGLRDDDWQRPGVHEESGPLTLLELVEHMAEHETEHLADIRAAAQ